MFDRKIYFYSEKERVISTCSKDILSQFLGKTDENRKLWSVLIAFNFMAPLIVFQFSE